MPGWGAPTEGACYHNCLSADRDNLLKNLAPIISRRERHSMIVTYCEVTPYGCFWAGNQIREPPLRRTR